MQKITIEDGIYTLVEVEAVDTEQALRQYLNIPAEISFGDLHGMGFHSPHPEDEDSWPDGKGDPPQVTNVEFFDDGTIKITMDEGTWWYIAEHALN